MVNTKICHRLFEQLPNLAEYSVSIIPRQIWNIPLLTQVFIKNKSRCDRKVIHTVFSFSCICRWYFYKNVIETLVRRALYPYVLSCHVRFFDWVTYKICSEKIYTWRTVWYFEIKRPFQIIFFGLCKGRT